MPNKKKQNLVSDLVSILKEKGSVVLVDYTGLTHAQLSGVRTKVFEAGGALRVVKNKLLMIALKEAKLPAPEAELTGPTAVVFAPPDDPAPVKEVYNQGKTLESLSIKWGIWGNELMDQPGIEQIAVLPGREVLLAKLVGSLKNPQTRLVGSLQSTLQKFVIALEEIRKQKE